jgi:hypothetical protein
MKKRVSFITAAVLATLLGLVMPASSSAAETTRWVTGPSCRATMTTLTCTGKGAGLQRPTNYPLPMVLSAPEVAILGDVHYICTGDGFEFTIRESGGPFDQTLASTTFHNGHSFSLASSPPAQPASMEAQNMCIFGVWTRDPNYYDVSVAIGFGFGSGFALVLLETSIGTVTAS